MSHPSLLFVNQHYWPDVASTGQHLTDLAEFLANDGFNVEVLCASGKYLSGRLDVAKGREVHNGVRIRRVKTTSFGRGSNIGRIADYASFYTQVLGRLLFGRKFDLVIVLTTPPLLGFACATAGKLRRQRFAIWSMDLHPDAEEALGMLKSGGIVTRLLHSMNGFGYRNADLIVDLGPVMKQRLLNKKVAADRLQTIPVWNKADEVFPVKREDNPLRIDLGLDDKFVIMYSGNAGLAHRFDEVFEVMRRLNDHPDIFFLFVGAGPRRAEIEGFIRENHIVNARYLDYYSRDKLAYSLSIGDVHILTLHNDMGGIAAPGKLYGIMAAGRPVVVVGPLQSEPALTTIEEQVGVVVDTMVHVGSDAADRLEVELLGLYNNPTKRQKIGTHARRVFMANYEQSVVCKYWSQMLQQQTVPTRTPIGVKLPQLLP